MCETCGCSDEAKVRLIDVNTGKVVLPEMNEHDHSHSHEHSHNHVDAAGQSYEHSHMHEHEHSHAHENEHSHAHEHEHSHAHEHEHGHTHEHEHIHAHDHSHDHAHSHNQKQSNQARSSVANASTLGATDKSLITIGQDILSKNNSLAQKNRRWLLEHKIASLNFVSAPGSGKTTLLEKTLNALKNEMTITVLEGDQETSNDAMRIKSTGCKVMQINTGAGCHLEADIVGRAMQHLNPPDNSLMIIENVGNLVCPALFDLGEQHKVVVLSVTEGEDKPLKYPHMFRAADIMILNKIDLMPHLEYDLEECLNNAKSVNDKLQIFQVSATRGNGMNSWLDWLRKFAACGLVSLSLLLVFFLMGTNPAQAQEWAKAKLNKSPRHLDWVKLKRGDRELNCFIAYPEVKGKATTVLVIHEIFGLSDWVRGVCDDLAAHGFIAIAPDLLSGKEGVDSSNYKDADAQRKAITSLPPEQVTEDLNAVSKYASSLPAGNGKLAVAGFCWGGTQTFRYATNNSSIKSAFVFYGTAPENAADLARIKAPVFGFYGEKDARVTSTIDKTTSAMKEAGKTYEPKTYTDAGHGFMRSGEAPDADAPNKAARTDSWKRWDDELRKL